MKKFLLWFASFFDEDNGASTTRALAWIWTLTFCITILVMSGVIIHKATSASDIKLPPLDNGYVLVTSIIFAAKVGQKVWGEQNTTPTVPTVAQPVAPTPPTPSAVGALVTAVENVISPQPAVAAPPVPMVAAPVVPQTQNGPVSIS